MTSQALFMKANIFAVMEHRKSQLKKAVNEMQQATLDGDSEDALAERLAQDYGLDVPVLDESGKYAMHEEVDVAVQYNRDGTPVFNISGGPVIRHGLKITIVVPFKGDAALFNVQPTSFDSNPPMAELHSGDIRLVYTVVDPPFDADGASARALSQINRYLGNLRPSAEQLETELKRIAVPLIRRKKLEFAGHAQILSSLKIPIRNPVPGPQYSPAAHRGGGASETREPVKWDVFISHASEDKEAIARPLADALQEKGLRVWYDDFSLRLGDSLRQSIDRGLARSRFGVVILSAHFFEKHWPRQELNGLATREINGEKVILPVWHEVGFAEVRGYSVTLADRIAVQTKDGLAHVVEKITEVVK